MVTAYAVLFIDVNTSPPSVMGAGIFSERSPTTYRSDMRLAILFKIDGASYGVAADKAWEILSSQMYNWTGEPDPKRMSRKVRPA